jgi:PAS domain S-box-containing protein
MPRHARRETALVDLGRLVLEGASPSDLMRAAPALIAAELQLGYVQLFDLPPLDNAVRLMASTGPDRAAIGCVEQLDPDSLLTEVALRAGEPVVISDWQGESRLKPPAVLRDADISSSVSIAITAGRGEPIYGFLSVHSRKPRPFPDDEIQFLKTVGNLLAHAVASARSTRSFSALLENAPDVIVYFDNDLRIAYANPATERTTGTPAGSLVGKTSSDLGILESLVPTWELVLRHVWRSARWQAFELTVRTPIGERVLDSRIVPEPGPDGSVQSLLTISRDVTEQRRAEADRLALYQQLVTQQNRVQELMSRLAQEGQRPHERSPLPSQLEHLSDRERHLLRLLAAGRSNREIGAEIGRATGTVKNHVARLLSKLNVGDRTQAAVLAVEVGLVHVGADQ